MSGERATIRPLPITNHALPSTTDEALEDEVSRAGWASHPPSDASCVAAFPKALERFTFSKDRSGGTPEPAGRMLTLPETHHSPPLQRPAASNRCGMQKGPAMLASSFAGPGYCLCPATGVLLDNSASGRSDDEVYFDFFTFAQRRRAASAIFARASGLMLRLPLFLAGLDDAVGAGAPDLRASQRAFIAAASRARPAGVSPLLALAGALETAPPAFLFAQRAFCAAAILARASSEIKRLPPRLPLEGADDGPDDAVLTSAELPSTEFNSACSFSICSAMAAACLS